MPTSALNVLVTMRYLAGASLLNMLDRVRGY